MATSINLGTAGGQSGTGRSSSTEKASGKSLGIASVSSAAKTSTAKTTGNKAASTGYSSTGGSSQKKTTAPSVTTQKKDSTKEKLNIRSIFSEKNMSGQKDKNFNITSEPVSTNLDLTKKAPRVGGAGTGMGVVEAVKEMTAPVTTTANKDDGYKPKKIVSAEDAFKPKEATALDIVGGAGGRENTALEPEPTPKSWSSYSSEFRDKSRNNTTFSSIGDWEKNIMALVDDTEKYLYDTTGYKDPTVRSSYISQLNAIIDEYSIVMEDERFADVKGALENNQEILKAMRADALAQDAGYSQFDLKPLTADDYREADPTNVDGLSSDVFKGLLETRGKELDLAANDALQKQYEKALEVEKNKRVSDGVTTWYREYLGRDDVDWANEYYDLKKNKPSFLSEYADDEANIIYNNILYQAASLGGVERDEEKLAKQYMDMTDEDLRVSLEALVNAGRTDQNTGVVSSDTNKKDATGTSLADVKKEISSTKEKIESEKEALRKLEAENKVGTSAYIQGSKRISNYEKTLEALEAKKKELGGGFWDTVGDFAGNAAKSAIGFLSDAGISPGITTDNAFVSAAVKFGVSYIDAMLNTSEFDFDNLTPEQQTQYMLIQSALTAHAAENSYNKMAEALASVDSSVPEYERGQVAYETALQEYNTAVENYKAAEEKYNAIQSDMQRNSSAVTSSGGDIAAAQKELDNAKAAVAEAEEKKNQYRPYKIQGIRKDENFDNLAIEGHGMLTDILANKDSLYTYALVKGGDEFAKIALDNGWVKSYEEGLEVANMLQAFDPNIVWQNFTPSDAMKADERVDTFNYLLAKQGMRSAFEYALDTNIADRKAANQEKVSNEYELWKRRYEYADLTGNEVVLDAERLSRNFIGVAASLRDVIQTPELVRAYKHGVEYTSEENTWARDFHLQYQGMVQALSELPIEGLIFDKTPLSALVRNKGMATEIVGSAIQSTSLVMAAGALAGIIGTAVPVGAVSILGASGTELITSGIVNSVFFASTMTQTIYDKLDAGYDMDAATKTGFWYGLSEAAFETLSIDKLAKGLNTVAPSWGEAIIQIAASAGVEMSEEGFTTIANAISDAFVNGDESEIKQSIAQYVEMGYSEEEATRRAYKDFTQEVIDSVIAGGLSSIGSTGSSTITNAFVGKITGRQLNQIKDFSITLASMARSIPEEQIDADYREKIADVSSRIIKNGKATDMELGSLYDSVQKGAPEAFADFIFTNPYLCMQASPILTADTITEKLKNVIAEEPLRQYLKAIQNSDNKTVLSPLGETLVKNGKMSTDDAIAAQSILADIFDGSTSYNKELIQSLVENGKFSDVRVRRALLAYFKQLAADNPSGNFTDIINTALKGKNTQVRLLRILDGAWTASSTYRATNKLVYQAGEEHKDFLAAVEKAKADSKQKKKSNASAWSLFKKKGQTSETPTSNAENRGTFANGDFKESNADKIKPKRKWVFRRDFLAQGGTNEEFNQIADSLPTNRVHHAVPNTGRLNDSEENVTINVTNSNAEGASNEQTTGTGQGPVETTTGESAEGGNPQQGTVVQATVSGGENSDTQSGDGTRAVSNRPSEGTGSAGGNNLGGDSVSQTTESSLTPKVQKLSRKVRQGIKALGGTVGLKLKANPKVKSFINALQGSIDNNPTRGASVDPQTEESLEGARLFLSENKMAGAAVTPDGNLIAVFNNPSNPIRKCAAELTATAVANGAVKADCFMTDTPTSLVNKYAQVGFIPVSYMDFDQSFWEADHPGKTWPAEMGSPKCVFMVYNGQALEENLKNAAENQADVTWSFERLQQELGDPINDWDYANEVHEVLAERVKAGGQVTTADASAIREALSNKYDSPQAAEAEAPAAAEITEAIVEAEAPAAAEITEPEVKTKGTKKTGKKSKAKKAEQAGPLRFTAEEKATRIGERKAAIQLLNRELSRLSQRRNAVYQNGNNNAASREAITNIDRASEVCRRAIAEAEAQLEAYKNAEVIDGNEANDRSRRADDVPDAGRSSSVSTEQTGGKGEKETRFQGSREKYERLNEYLAKGCARLSEDAVVLSEDEYPEDVKILVGLFKSFYLPEAYFVEGDIFVTDEDGNQVVDTMPDGREIPVTAGGSYVTVKNKGDKPYIVLSLTNHGTGSVDSNGRHELLHFILDVIRQTENGEAEVCNIIDTALGAVFDTDEKKSRMSTVLSSYYFHVCKKSHQWSGSSYEVLSDAQKYLVKEELLADIYGTYNRQLPNGLYNASAEDTVTLEGYLARAVVPRAKGLANAQLRGYTNRMHYSVNDVLTEYNEKYNASFEEVTEENFIDIAVESLGDIKETFDSVVKASKKEYGDLTTGRIAKRVISTTSDFMTNAENMTAQQMLETADLLEKMVNSTDTTLFSEELDKNIYNQIRNFAKFFEAKGVDYAHNKVDGTLASVSQLNGILNGITDESVTTFDDVADKLWLSSDAPEGARYSINKGLLATEMQLEDDFRDLGAGDKGGTPRKWYFVKDLSNGGALLTARSTEATSDIPYYIIPASQKKPYQNIRILDSEGPVPAMEDGRLRSLQEGEDPGTIIYLSRGMEGISSYRIIGSKRMQMFDARPYIFDAHGNLITDRTGDGRFLATNYLDGKTVEYVANKYDELTADVSTSEGFNSNVYSYKASAELQALVNNWAFRKGYTVHVFRTTSSSEETTFTRLVSYDEPGKHAGTYGAADDIKSFPYSGQSVGAHDWYLKPGKSLFMPDIWGSYVSLATYVEDIHNNNYTASTIINTAEELPINDDFLAYKSICNELSTLRLSEIKDEDEQRASEAARKYLVNLGYDTISYLNGSEDKGSVSWIILNPNNVKDARVVTFDDAGNKINLTERFDDSKHEFRFSVNPGFLEEYDAWYAKVVEANSEGISRERQAALDKEINDAVMIVGTLDGPFAELGMPARLLILKGKTIYGHMGNVLGRSKGSTHPEMLTAILGRQIAEIINNPVLIVASHMDKGPDSYSTRMKQAAGSTSPSIDDSLFVYSTVRNDKAINGDDKIVRMTLILNPTDNMEREASTPQSDFMKLGLESWSYTLAFDTYGIDDANLMRDCENILWDNPDKIQDFFDIVSPGTKITPRPGADANSFARIIREDTSSKPERMISTRFLGTYGLSSKYDYHSGQAILFESRAEAESVFKAQGEIKGLKDNESGLDPLKLLEYKTHEKFKGSREDMMKFYQRANGKRIGIMYKDGNSRANYLGDATINAGTFTNARGERTYRIRFVDANMFDGIKVIDLPARKNGTYDISKAVEAVQYTEEYASRINNELKFGFKASDSNRLFIPADAIVDVIGKNDIISPTLSGYVRQFLGKYNNNELVKIRNAYADAAQKLEDEFTRTNDADFAESSLAAAIEKEYIEKILAGRGTVFSVNDDVTSEYLPEFYSAASKYIESGFGKSRRIDEVIPFLMTQTAKKNGVREDEIVFSGLRGYLNELKAEGATKVTREQLASFLSNSGLGIKVTRLDNQLTEVEKLSVEEQSAYYGRRITEAMSDISDIVQTRNASRVLENLPVPELGVLNRQYSWVPGLKGASNSDIKNKLLGYKPSGNFILRYLTDLFVSEKKAKYETPFSEEFVIIKNEKIDKGTAKVFLDYLASEMSIDTDGLMNQSTYKDASLYDGAVKELIKKYNLGSKGLEVTDAGVDYVSKKAYLVRITGFLDDVLRGGIIPSEQLVGFYSDMYPEFNVAAFNDIIAEVNTLFTVIEDNMREAEGVGLAGRRSKDTSKYSSYTLRGAIGAKDRWAPESTYKELLFRKNGLNFDNPHYRQYGDTLVHARMADYVDLTDGSTVSFIDEIQSDIHNRGKKNGYLKDGETATVGEYGAVQDAPFKKTYHELVLKSAIYDAVKRGIKRIAWTTAELQVDRWSGQYRQMYQYLYGFTGKELEKGSVPEYLNSLIKQFGGATGWTVIGEASERDTIENEIREYGRNNTIKTVMNEEEDEYNYKNDMAYHAVPYFDISDELASAVSDKGLPRFSVNDITNENVTEPRTFADAIQLTQVTDSNGNRLSWGQVWAFRNSKARDENGRLLGVYHGGSRQNEWFDKALVGRSGDGFYMTDSLEVALTYSGGGEAKSLLELPDNYNNPFNLPTYYEFAMPRISEIYEKGTTESPRSVITDIHDEYTKELLDKLSKVKIEDRIAEFENIEGNGLEFVKTLTKKDFDDSVKELVNNKGVPENIKAAYDEGRFFDFLMGVHDFGYRITDDKLRQLAKNVDRFYYKMGESFEKPLIEDNLYLFNAQGDPYITRIETEFGINSVLAGFASTQPIGSRNTNYVLYANLENPVIVDAGGAWWGGFEVPMDRENALKFGSDYDEVSGTATVNTQSMVLYAKSIGADGVIIKNVWDAGGFDTGVFGGSKTPAATDIIAFETEQVKDQLNRAPMLKSPFYAFSVNGGETSGFAQYFEISDKLADYVNTAANFENLGEVTPTNTAGKPTVTPADVESTIFKTADGFEITKPGSAEEAEMLTDITDSRGNRISRGQAWAFRNSKVRDRSGRLLSLFHGDTGNYKFFDKTKTGYKNDGFYLTDDFDVATGYSDSSESISQWEQARISNGLLSFAEFAGDRINAAYSEEGTYEDPAAIYNDYVSYVQNEAKNISPNDKINSLKPGVIEADGSIIDDAFLYDKIQAIINSPEASDELKYYASKNSGYDFAEYCRNDYYFQKGISAEYKSKLKEIVDIMDALTWNSTIDHMLGGEMLYGVTEKRSYGPDKSYYLSESEIDTRFSELATPFIKMMGNNIQMYANITNPYIYEANGNQWTSLNIPMTKEEYDNAVAHGVKFEDYNEREQAARAITHGVFLYARYLGHDGVIIKDIIDTGSYSWDDLESTVVITADSEQAKDRFNRNPNLLSPFYAFSVNDEDNIANIDGLIENDIATLVENEMITEPANDEEAARLTNITDSKGNRLSRGQLWAFKDSKARDEEGRLLMLYHGTRSNIKYFDKGRTNHSDDGFYMSDELDIAKSYSGEYRTISQREQAEKSAGIMSFYEFADERIRSEYTAENYTDPAVIYSEYLDYVNNELNKVSIYEKIDELSPGAIEADGSLIEHSDIMNAANNIFKSEEASEEMKNTISGFGAALICDMCAIEYYTRTDISDEYKNWLKVFVDMQPLVSYGDKLLDMLRDGPAYGVIETLPNGETKNYYIPESTINYEFSKRFYSPFAVKLTNNIPMYADVRNPYILDAEGRWWHDIRIPMEAEEYDEAIYDGGVEGFDYYDYDGGYASVKTLGVFQYAKYLGHDGVIIKNVVDPGKYAGSMPSSTVVITVDSEQQKDAYNRTPNMKSPFFAFSTNDSEGNELTKEQISYFEDTVTTQDGEHITKLHLGNRSSGVFNKPVYWMSDSPLASFGFAESLNTSKLYSDMAISESASEVYAKITNPFVVDFHGYMESNVPLSVLPAEFLSSGFKRTGKLTDELVKFAQLNGYDGIIFDNIVDGQNWNNKYMTTPVQVVGVFDSLAVRNANNKSPSYSNDMRLSMNTDRMTYDSDGNLKTAAEIMGAVEGPLVDPSDRKTYLSFTLDSEKKQTDKVKLRIELDEEIELLDMILAMDRGDIPADMDELAAMIKSTKAVQKAERELRRQVPTLVEVAKDDIEELSKTRIVNIVEDFGETAMISKFSKEELERRRTSAVAEILSYGSAGMYINEKGEAKYDYKKGHKQPVRQEHIAHIVTGLPAAGKSSVFVNKLSNFYSARVIDSDDVKDSRTFKEEYLDGWGSSAVHVESKDVLETVLATSIANGDNIVYPVIGDSLNSILKKAKLFKQPGSKYKVFVHYNELPFNKSLSRAFNRFRNELRYIATDVLLEYGDKPFDAYLDLVDAFREGRTDLIDGYTWFSNNVAPESRPIQRVVSEEYGAFEGRYRPRESNRLDSEISENTLAGRFSVNDYADEFLDVFADTEGNTGRYNDTPFYIGLFDTSTGDVVETATRSQYDTMEFPFSENYRKDWELGKLMNFWVSDGKLFIGNGDAITKEFLRDFGNIPEILANKLETAIGTSVSWTQNRVNRYSVNNSEATFRPGSIEEAIAHYIKTGDLEGLQQYAENATSGHNTAGPSNAEQRERQVGDTVRLRDEAGYQYMNDAEKQAMYDKNKELGDKYGYKDEGEKFKEGRPNIPNKKDKDKNFRQGAQNFIGAETIPDYMAEEFLKIILNEKLMAYSPHTDVSAIKFADDTYNDYMSRFGEDGLDKMVAAEWTPAVRGNGRLNKNTIAIGEKILMEASHNNRPGLTMQMFADLCVLGTELGQAVQGYSLLKKMTPAGQCYYLTRTVQRLNKQYEDVIAKGNMRKIEIDQALAEEVYNARNKDELDEAIAVVMQDIADQLPVTWMDRWNAWRYFAMLGNPRTHIRNILGNAVFTPAVFVKNVLGTAGEHLLVDKSMRTKAIFVDKKYRDFAKQMFDTDLDILKGGGKFSAGEQLRSLRHIWGESKAGMLMEDIMKINTDGFDSDNPFVSWIGLEKEDLIFLKAHYINALAGFLQARGADVNKLYTDQRSLLNEARGYAIREAQRATYRDYNSAAALLNQIKKSGGFAGILVDGVLPFTKTPMNVLRRGIEYSPIGLATGVYKTVKALYNFKGNNNEITRQAVTDALDSMCAGLSGTAIAILGFLLASSGLLRGSGGDDEDKLAAEELTGHQSYSLELGDVSYTIDWMAPVALPLFVGCEIFNAGQNQGLNAWETADAMLNIVDPMTSLSMLSGLNDTLRSISYVDDNKKMLQLLVSALTSYASQGLPTLGGQVARTLDGTRRQNYVDKNSDVPSWLQRSWQKNVMSKIPVLEAERTEYVDNWGRVDTESSRLLLAISNFLSPGYYNIINETQADTELKRLYEATGESGVLPQDNFKEVVVNGEKKYLTGEEYVQAANKRGQTAYALITEIINDINYMALSDDERVDVIKNAYDYANQTTKPDFGWSKQEAWVEVADEFGVADYIILRSDIQDAATNAALYELALTAPGLSEEQKGMLVAARYTAPDTVYSGKDATYEYTLSDSAKDRAEEIYNTKCVDNFVKATGTSEWKNATLDEQIELIGTITSVSKEQTKEQLGTELDKNALDSEYNMRSASSIKSEGGGYDRIFEIALTDESLDTNSQAKFIVDAFGGSTSRHGVKYTTDMKAYQKTLYEPIFLEEYSALVSSKAFKAKTLEEQKEAISKLHKLVLSDTSELTYEAYLADAIPKATSTQIEEILKNQYIED